MAITALGPTNAGGMQPIVEEGYELTYYPDVMNAELQLSGKAPVFYYMPKRLSMARRDGTEDGDFLFNWIRFAGVQSADSTVGGTGVAVAAPRFPPPTTPPPPPPPPGRPGVGGRGSEPRSLRNGRRDGLA